MAAGTVLGTGFMVVFYIIYVMIMGAIALGMYLLQGFSLMKISKKLGIPKGWRGFIPFADYYLMGKIAEEDTKRYHPEKKVTKWSKIFLFCQIALGVLLTVWVVVFMVCYFALWFSVEGSGELTAGGAASMVGLLLLFLSYFLILALAIGVSVVSYFVYYKIYHVMAKDHAIWMLLLSIFVSGANLVILAVLAFMKRFPTDLPEPAAQDIIVPAADVEAVVSQDAVEEQQKTVCCTAGAENTEIE
ncbi:MAG: hypothetical protein IJZ37_06670 [Clostridia bacterium]|nr:hypothetical protein [Clostridia bacterium]